MDNFSVNQKNHEQTELLRLINICARNNKSIILRNMNFSVLAGEVHALVSTSEFLLQKFLDTLAGKIALMEGKMLFCGKETTPKELVKDQVNFICQETFLFHGFTALNNIYIKDAAFYHSSIRKKRAMAEKLSQEFQLDIDLSQDVAFLTAEEQKIIELLRAYCMDVPVVVLHDTFNIVNAEYISLVKKIIKKMIRQGKGIIYATTDIEDALNFSTRISILDNGTIKGVFRTEQAVGDPRKIMSRISGWDKFYTETEENGINSKMYNALVRSREIITSSYEIKHVIHALAVDFRYALSADGCIIYLMDEGTNGIINSAYPEEIVQLPILTNEYIRRCTEKMDGIFVTKADPKFEEYFEQGCRNIETLICANVWSDGKQIGLIQMWHQSTEPASAKKMRYLNSFAREVAIAVETSRLMGRSVLLQESHHRIKNNLQLIINLIYMQKTQLLQENAEMQDINGILESVIERIKSIAIVHDMFSNNSLGQGSIGLQEMALKLIKMYSVANIQYRMEMDDIGIPYSKASSIALVINELLNNCVKHAFPDEQKEKIVCLYFKYMSEDVVLRITDNGIGLPEKFSMKNRSSLGISIITTIIESLQGSLIYQTRKDTHGTCAEVRFHMCSLYN